MSAPRIAVFHHEPQRSTATPLFGCEPTEDGLGAEQRARKVTTAGLPCVDQGILDSRFA